MIHAYATWPHHQQHLAPIWRALDPAIRGSFFVGGMATSRRSAVALDLEPESGMPGWADPPVLVASGGDLPLVKNAILAEHGAGQTYVGLDHACWPGGAGRGNVVLFLCPNEQVAEVNAARYPGAQTAVVGSPHVEALRALPPYPKDRHRICLSTHWQSGPPEELRGGWPHYEEVFRELVLADPEDFVIHGHPRYQDYTAWKAREWGCEFVADFADVVNEAWLYVVDNSSTGFEWMALNRPVIWYSPPWFRRGVDHGLRFWTFADAAVHVEKPADMESAILTALADPTPIRQRRMTVARHLFGHDLSAHAAARAARACEEVAG